MSWFAYTLIADSLSLVQWWSGSIVDWIVAVLAIDLSYYWFHRISHRVRLFWSFHVVHHQSESYNLSVALRQAGLRVSVLDLLHTVVDRRLASNGVGCHKIDKSALPILDTYAVDWSAAHRIGMDHEQPVESPCSSRAGRSISRYELWRYFYCLGSDFGTYKAELEEPPYGTVSPIKAWDPVHANVEGLQKIGSFIRASTNWKERSLAIFGPPEWSPLTLESETETRDSLYGQAPQFPSSTLTYVLIHFTFTTAWLLYWLSGTSDANVGVNVALAASVVTGLWSWGALLGGAVSGNSWKSLDW